MCQSKNRTQTKTKTNKKKGESSVYLIMETLIKSGYDGIFPE